VDVADGAMYAAEETAGVVTVPGPPVQEVLAALAAKTLAVLQVPSNNSAMVTSRLSGGDWMRTWRAVKLPVSEFSQAESAEPPLEVVGPVQMSIHWPLQVAQSSSMRKYFFKVGE